MPVIQNMVGLTLDRIVVATDFTLASEMAIEHARVLAKHFASSLTVVHVLDPPAATRAEAAVFGLSLDKLRHDSAENMERVLNDLASSGIRADGKTLEAYNAAAAVASIAEQLDADILITGTESRHGFSKMIAGSFADGVIHHVKCPVLTVGPKVKKPTSRVSDWNTIVFATDLQHDTAEKAAVALMFARDRVAKIYMCHVLAGGEEDFGERIERQLESELALKRLIPDSAYEWCSPECIVASGDIAKHLVALIKRTGADVIILGAHPSTTWFTHLTDGVVEKVIAEAECPVMSICTG